MRLLGQLLGEFYLAKRREQKLQHQRYLLAVHEIGACLTHDVKNLLQNALAKRQADPAVRIRASLVCDARLAFRVIDSGLAVPPEIERLLMRSPLPSAGGLGIGLYQVARQAEASGYALNLECNRDGEVCFAFTGPLGSA